MWRRMEAGRVADPVPSHSAEGRMMPAGVGTVRYARSGHSLPGKRLGRGWKAVLGSTQAAEGKVG